MLTSELDGAKISISLSTLSSRFLIPLGRRLLLGWMALFLCLQLSWSGGPTPAWAQEQRPPLPPGVAAGETLPTFVNQRQYQNQYRQVMTSGINAYISQFQDCCFSMFVKLGDIRLYGFFPQNHNGVEDQEFEIFLFQGRYFRRAEGLLGGAAPQISDNPIFERGWRITQGDYGNETNPIVVNNDFLFNANDFREYNTHDFWHEANHCALRGLNRGADWDHGRIVNYAERAIDQLNKLRKLEQQPVWQTAKKNPRTPVEAWTAVRDQWINFATFYGPIMNRLTKAEKQQYFDFTGVSFPSLEDLRILYTQGGCNGVVPPPQVFAIPDAAAGFTTEIELSEFPPSRPKDTSGFSRFFFEIRSANVRERPIGGEESASGVKYGRPNSGQLQITIIDNGGAPKASITIPGIGNNPNIVSQGGALPIDLCDTQGANYRKYRFPVILNVPELADPQWVKDHPNATLRLRIAFSPTPSTCIPEAQYQPVSRDLEINLNPAPQKPAGLRVEIIPSKSTLKPGETLSLQSRVTPGIDPVNLAYRWSMAGKDVGTGPSYKFPGKDYEGQAVKVKLTVKERRTDGKAGQEGSAEAVIKVEKAKTEEELDARIALSNPNPAENEPFTASLVTVKGKIPADAVLQWEGSGGVHLEGVANGVATFKGTDDGVVYANLIRDSKIIRKIPAGLKIKKAAKEETKAKDKDLPEGAQPATKTEKRGSFQDDLEMDKKREGLPAQDKRRMGIAPDSSSDPKKTGTTGGETKAKAETEEKTDQLKSLSQLNESEKKGLLDCLCYWSGGGSMTGYYDPDSPDVYLGVCMQWGALSGWRVPLNPRPDKIEECFRRHKVIYNQAELQALIKNINRKAKRPLEVAINAARTKLQPGQTAEFTAQVSGGTKQYTYQWGGSATGRGEKATITAPQKPGSFSVTLTVTDADGDQAAATLNLMVEGLQVKLQRRGPGEVCVGGSSRFQATVVGVSGEPVSGNYVIRGQPQPEVTFDRPESQGTTAEVQATFRRPGSARVWVEVLEQSGGVLRTVAESEQLTVMVQKPELEVIFSPANPRIGQEITATVRIKGPCADQGGALDFRWQPLPGNAQQLSEAGDKRSVTFIPKDTLPITVTVLGRTPHYGDDLGRASGTVQATGYQVKATVIGPMGPSPVRWDPARGGLVADPKAIAIHQNVRVQASVTPEPPKGPLRYRWSVNEDSHIQLGQFSSEILVNRSQVGTCQVTVAAEDGEGHKLGSAAASFAVTVDQGVVSKELRDGALKRAAADRLDEAINLAEQAAKLDPVSTANTNLVTKLREEKALVLSKVKKANNLMSQGKLTEAAAVLAEAQKLHRHYPAVEEAARLLDQAKAKDKGGDQEMAQRLRLEGEALEGQKKLAEAIGKYQESLKKLPDVKLAEHVNTLQAMVKEEKIRKETAKRLRDEAAAFHQQGKLAEAIGKYKESLRHYPDPKLEEHIKALQTAEHNQKLQAKLEHETKAKPGTGIDRTTTTSYPGTGAYKGNFTLYNVRYLNDPGDKPKVIGTIVFTLNNGIIKGEIIPWFYRGIITGRVNSQTGEIQAEFNAEYEMTKAPSRYSLNQVGTYKVQGTMTGHIRGNKASGKISEVRTKISGPPMPYPVINCQGTWEAEMETATTQPPLPKTKLEEVKSAQTDLQQKADRLWAEGMALERRGDLNGALRKFEEAYRVVPNQNAKGQIEKLKKRMPQSQDKKVP